MKKKIFIITFLAVALVVGGFFFFNRSSASSETVAAKIKVTRATIIDKALAVGTIEPENEISIKSKVGGVVSSIFVQPGSYVKAGQPLIDVRPAPAPSELADAKRQVELAQVDLTNAQKEQNREDTLIADHLISQKEFEDAQRTFDNAELHVKMTTEALALLQSGKVTIDNTEIESIVRAPIDGFVLNKAVEVGDPVTPLSTYQEGTVLMKMANMENLLFKGNVDEIDVGKLKEGMRAEIKVGALPKDTVIGILTKISLKAEKQENATVFPIEILVPKTTTVTLRAGYSANANIIILKKDNVLSIPERAVTFRNDSAFVRIALAQGKEEERFIKTGLSDAINIEVLAGLNDGDSIAEKPVKKIE
jgi:HlyD family secretion protein